MHPSDIYKEIVTLGEAWADANAAAELLEETKCILVSQLMSETEGSSIAAREAAARRNPKYEEHIKSMVEARRRANRMRARHEAMKINAEMWRTEQANERAAMREAT